MSSCAVRSVRTFLTADDQDLGIPRGVRVLLLLLVAACGDNQLPQQPLFDGTSGERLKLEWYLYQDGARQREAAGFYDAKLHTRCAPARWADDVTRCTPLGDPAVFVDADCMLEVGRKLGERRPKHFIRYERIAGELRPAGVLAAGDVVATVPTTFYERRDGACVQIGEQPNVAYYDVGEPIEPERMVEVWPEQIAGERLSLRTLVASEGLVAPMGLRDEELGIDCRAEQRGDGTTACVPEDVIAAQHFADPFCEEPVAVTLDEPPPAIAVADTAGCSSYRALATEHTGQLFRRDGATCVQVLRMPGERAYVAGAPLALASLDRTIEALPGRRLQQITLAGGGLLLLDGLLHDTATRTDCRHAGNGELAVCVPTTTLTGARVYANARCGRELLIADVPEVACEPSAFAIVDDLAIHAIGSAHDEPLYVLDAAAQCRPRPRPPGTVPHVLGPALPLDTFVAGVVFSER